MVWKTYSVYNGVGFVPVTPNSENIGKKLIDLAMRVYVYYISKERVKL